MSLEAQLREQQKIIEFLAGKYERDTGRKLPIPSQIGQLLGDKSILGSRDKIPDPDLAQSSGKKKKLTFNQAVEKLDLPKPEKLEKGKQKSSKKSLTFAPHHLISKIDLSGHLDATRSSIKDLLESIELMPGLRALSLRNCNLSDDVDKEILSIFDIKTLTKVDLSQNHLKKTGMLIGKKLKDEVQHISWIDLTQNEFDQDTAAITTIIAGLKKQKEVNHIGLTCQEQIFDSLLKTMLAPKRPPISLNLRNSKLSKNSAEFLKKQLEHPEIRITALSLKFTFLEFEKLYPIIKAFGPADKANGYS